MRMELPAALLVLVAAGCGGSRAKLPVTLSQLEAAEGFADLGFVLAGPNAPDRPLIYRPDDAFMARKIAMRVRADGDGSIRAISLGIAHPILASGGLFLRGPLVGLIRAVLPPADSAGAAELLSQIEHNLLGAADSGFYYREEGDTLLPAKPTAGYLGFLGLARSVTETYPASSIRFDRLGEGAAAVVVLTVAAPGMTIPLGEASDWVEESVRDLLGAPLDAVLRSDVLMAADLVEVGRTPSRVSLATVSEVQDGDSTAMWDLALGADGRVEAVTIRFPLTGDDGEFDKQAIETTVNLAFANLVPRMDSVLAMEMLRAIVVGIELSPASARYAADVAGIAAVAGRTKTRHALSLPHCSVLVETPAGGSAGFVVLTVARPTG